MSANPGTGSPAARGTSDSTQRSSQRGGNRGRSNGSSQDAPQRPSLNLRHFTGKEAGLGDKYVYQYTDGREASDQYSATTEEIIRYSSSKFHQGADVERSLDNKMKVAFVMPIKPTEKDGDETLYKMELSIVLKRRNELDYNLQSAYALIKGQCDKPILEKVESQHGYAAAHHDRDPIMLLALIKAVMFNYNSRKYRAVSIIELINIDLASQTPYMPTSEYRDKFRTQMDVLKSCGGDICLHPGMVADELDRASSGLLVADATTEELDAATVRARSRFEGTLFLLRGNPKKYGRLVQELANDFNKGQDSYPATLTAAYELMLHDVRDQDSRPPARGNPGMAFSTVGEGGQAPGTAGTNTQPNPRPDIVCRTCGKVGHFSNKCAEVNHANGTVLCNMVEDRANTAGADEGVAMAHVDSPTHDHYTVTHLSTQ
jgi:hypothetical protein